MQQARAADWLCVAVRLACHGEVARALTLQVACINTEQNMSSGTLSLSLEFERRTEFVIWKTFLCERKLTMEIALVHTTGSPSRHDSDSDPSYDRKRQSKSSSEMALHRKPVQKGKRSLLWFSCFKPRHSAHRAPHLLSLFELSQDCLKVIFISSRGQNLF